MTDSILLNTINGNSQNRPPFWYMRQAGRVLPSYMKLKEKYSFWQLMKDPDLAAQVTLLPIKDLGVDAAILFSDILVVPYAMGMGLEFTDTGPQFETPLVFTDDPLKRLNPDSSRLEYIYNAIDRIIERKPGNIPLIGFCGAPLTVICYMLQGVSRNPEFPDAVKFIYHESKKTMQLIDVVVELSLEYIQAQIDHGIHVFQLFESHAGVIPLELYNKLFLPAVKKIAALLRDNNIPFIFFPKGYGLGLKNITPEICDYVSVDYQYPIQLIRKMVHPEVGLQGNLDPRILYGNKTEIEQHLVPFIEFGADNRNWIFNLGHGFLPDIPYENALFLSKWIKYADWKR